MKIVERKGKINYFDRIDTLEFDSNIFIRVIRVKEFVSLELKYK